MSTSGSDNEATDEVRVAIRNAHLNLRAQFCIILLSGTFGGKGWPLKIYPVIMLCHFSIKEQGTPAIHCRQALATPFCLS
jgi:hypothetical protein